MRNGMKNPIVTKGGEVRGARVGELPVLMRQGGGGGTNPTVPEGGLIPNFRKKTMTRVGSRGNCGAPVQRGSTLKSALL